MNLAEPPVDLSDLIALIEVALLSSGLAKPQRAKRNGIPTDRRRWVLTDPPTLRRYMGKAVERSDGAKELAEIKAIAAANRIPFWEFRHSMSHQALYRLYRYLRFRSYLLTREPA